MDIFTPPEKVENYLPDEIIKESQKIQEEIKSLLSEVIAFLIFFYYNFLSICIFVMQSLLLGSFSQFLSLEVNHWNLFLADVVDVHNYL